MDDLVVDEFLAHHGVMGMKWGVRKTPAEKKASEKAKTEKRNEKAKKYDARAAKYQAQYNKVYNSNRRNKYDQLVEINKQRERAEKDAQLKREGKLSTGQKKTLKVGVGVGVVVAAYTTYSSIQSGNARRLTEKGGDWIHHQPIHNFKLKPELTNSNMSADDIFNKVVKPINPDYGEIGTKMNCRRATYAYEMRRRGYDVMATRTTNARGQDIMGQFNAHNPTNPTLIPHTGAIGLWQRRIKELRKPERDKEWTNAIKGYRSFPSIPGTHKVSPKSLITDLTSQSEPGQRGELMMAWTGGGAHSMAWENIKGKVVVFDNQTRKTYKSQADFSELSSRMSLAQMTRLDNLPMNADYLMRWVKDA